MILNPNKELVEKIKFALTRTNGYCPCYSQQNEDTICPCKMMREKEMCHCGLYVPIIVYSTIDCIGCISIKQWLNENNIKFVSKDLYNDEDAKDEIVNSGVNFIPIIRLGNQYYDNMDEVKQIILDNRIGDK